MLKGGKSQVRNLQVSFKSLERQH